MFTSPVARKLVRLALTTAAAGAGTAFLLLGAPADAAIVVNASRGI